MQLTTEVDKYLQETAEKREMDVNYFDGRHVATNTISQKTKSRFSRTGERQDTGVNRS